MIWVLIKEPAGPVVPVRYAGEVVRSIPLTGLRLRDFRDSVPWRTWRSRRGKAHLSGSYWSATMGSHVVHESRLELARLLLADFDPEVAAIYAQPFLLEAAVGGRVRRHVPDFLLGLGGGRVGVVNVKPAHRLEDPKIVGGLAWPGELLRRHGWGYEVWSGADPVLLDNVAVLAAYRRRWVVSAQAMEGVWRAVGDGEQLAVVEHRLAGGGRGDVRPAVLALLWSGRLVTDLTRPLSGACVLRRVS